MRRLKSLVCGEDGAVELVEFALASAILFTLIFGIVGFCQVLYAGNFVATAAQMGSRYEMVRGTDWTGLCTSVGQLACNDTTANTVITYITNMPHPGLATANITVAPPNWMSIDATGNACTPGTRECQVQVTVTYTFQLKAYYFTRSFPLSSTSTETIQN
jgi:Flp pilus assembly protein TadG